MEVIILSTQQYTDLVNRLEILNKKLEEKQKKPEATFLDNQEFIQLMHISKRTAQTWRDSGVISYSQIGSKIYYRMSDVQKLLDTNYKQTSANSNNKLHTKKAVKLNPISEASEIESSMIKLEK